MVSSRAGTRTTSSTPHGRGPTRQDEAPDPTLQHPRSVFQILTRHFARYTPAMVEEVCGVPADSFLRIASAFCRASGPERTGAICYAVGWTQHSTGVQIIRTAAILQLLLGNIGRPGGGILALRGHASIQGSTDIPTLFDILPGYLPMPSFGANDATLDGYVSTASIARGVVGKLRQVRSSRCSRRGTATRRQQRTSSASAGCPASAAITRTSATGSTWPTASRRTRAIDARIASRACS